MVSLLLGACFSFGFMLVQAGTKMNEPIAEMPDDLPRGGVPNDFWSFRRQLIFLIFLARSPTKKRAERIHVATDIVTSVQTNHARRTGKVPPSDH